jgi:spermidine/putrescine transport system permease protein
MPTQILSMLKTSISPEVNALGTVMIVMTVGIPLIGGILIQLFTKLKRRNENRENVV